MDSLTTTHDGAESALHPADGRAITTVFRVTLAMLWTIVILVLCWMPRQWVQEIEEESSWFEMPNLDKVVHWGIFVVFAVLWLRLGSTRWRYAWVALGGLAVAAVSEIVQLLPAIGRDASLADAFTDVTGVVIGLVVARWVEPPLRWLESRLFHGSIS